MFTIEKSKTHISHCQNTQSLTCVDYEPFNGDKNMTFHEPEYEEITDIVKQLKFVDIDNRHDINCEVKEKVLVKNSSDQESHGDKYEKE